MRCRIRCAALLLLACVAFAHAEEVEEENAGPYVPKPEGDYVLHVGFEDDVSYVKSEDAKYAGQQVDIEDDGNGIEGDKVLMLQNPAQHYGLVFPFEKSVGGAGDFVLQYEVRLTSGMECGGAYLKVLAEASMPKTEEVNNETPYIIMFGPDKCGETNKVHFILRHQNPVSKEWEEKHLKSPPAIKTDKNSHLYTLVLRQEDHTFQILIDNEVVKEGALLEEMEPPINPPKQIDDPEDSKPEDWVDEAQIADPDATKPDDWDEDAPMEIPDMDAEKPEGWLDDEPEYVDDPDSEKPDDWDDEEDGPYEPPQIENPKCVEAPGCGEWVRPKKDNPDYKGKWSAPMIDNPEYKGEWSPQQIDNPNFFVEENPSKLPQMAAVAVEIWTMSKGISFDNILIGTDPAVADAFAEATFEKKVDVQASSAKDKAKAERAAKRQQLLEDGSFSGKAQFYFGEVLEVAGDYPILAALVLIGGTFGLLFLIRAVCGRSKDPYEPKTPAAPNGAAEGDEKKEDGDEGDDGEVDEDEDADGDGDDDDEAEDEVEDEGESKGESKADSKKTGLRQRRKKKTRRAD